MISSVTTAAQLRALATPAPAPAPTPPPAPQPPANPQQPALKDTPYQKIKNSEPVKLMREHKVLTGLAAVGSAIVVAGGAAQSETFAKVAEYGIVPAIGAGLATVGAAAVHDAIVNDVGRDNALAAVKGTAGTVATLGGTQIVGATFDIPYLDRALTGPMEKLVDHGQAVVGLGVLGGGVAAGAFAANRIKAAINHSEHRAANAALGVASGLASATAVLGGVQLIGDRYGIPVADKALTATIEALSKTGLGSVVGGTLILGGSAVLAGEAVQNFRKGGNDLVTVVEGMGAITGALGGAELAGHGLGWAWTQGLLTNHAGTVGSIALAAGGAALTRTTLRDMKEEGVGFWNSAGLTGGLAAAPGGLGLTASTLGWHQAAEIGGRAAGVGAGVGLGVMSYALGKKAVNSARQGDVVTAGVAGVGSLATAAGSLGLIGEALEINAISEVGRAVARHTVEPVFEHVVVPVGEFLFNNPIAGGVIIVGGVGLALYLHYRNKNKTP